MSNVPFDHKYKHYLQNDFELCFMTVNTSLVPKFKNCNGIRQALYCIAFLDSILLESNNGNQLMWSKIHPGKHMILSKRDANMNNDKLMSRWELNIDISKDVVF